MEAAPMLTESKAAHCVKQCPYNVYVLFDTDTCRSYKNKNQTKFSFIMESSESDFLRGQTDILFGNDWVFTWLPFCLLKNTSQITSNWLIFEKNSFSTTYIVEMFQFICKQVLLCEHMYSTGETVMV